MRASAAFLAAWLLGSSALAGVAVPGTSQVIGIDVAHPASADNYSPASGAMTTPIMFYGNIGPPTTGTNYVSLWAGGFIAGTPLGKQVPSPVRGQIANMRVLLTTAILANYYTFSLNVNGVSTPLQCSIGQGGVNLGTTTTCSDSADQVIVNAGDLLAIQSSVPGGAPTAGNAFMTFAMTFTGANPQDSVIGGVTTNLSATAIQYAGFSEAAPVATDAVASSVMPTAGTLDRLYVALSATQAAGSSYQFTIMKNGVATGLVATCDVSSLCGDLSDAVNIVAGDTISLQFCPSGVAGCQGGNSPAVRAGEFSLRFKPSVVNQAMLFGMPSQFPPVVAALRLGALVSVVNFVSAVDTNYQSVAPGLSMTLGNLTVAQCPGPDSTGAGGVTRTFTARMGGVNQTPTVAIPGSSISACPALLTVRDTTHTFQATSGALLNLATSMNTVTNASTLAELKYSMTATVP